MIRSQDIRQLGARHHAVLRAVAGAQAGRRRRRPACGISTAAAAPCRSSARRTSRALVLLAQLDDLLALLIEPRFEPIDLDHQDRAGVERKAEVERRLDRFQDALVQHFQGAGMMPAPMMSLMVLVASSTDSKTPSSVRTPCGLRVRRTQALVTIAESAFAADDHAGQIEARGVFGRAAELHDRPSGSTISTPRT